MSTASGRSGTEKSWACALWPCAWVWATPPWLWVAPSESVDMVQPLLVLVHLAADRGEEGLLDLLRDFAGMARTDGPVVDGPDRHHLGRRTGQEGLVGQVQVGTD